MLRPGLWHYSDPNGNLQSFNATYSGFEVQGEYETSVFQPETIQGNYNPNAGQFNIPKSTLSSPGPGPGHAFLIDPLGSSNPTDPQNLDIFPYYSARFEKFFGIGNTNPWFNSIAPAVSLSGNRWPVRRLTVHDAGGLMSYRVAETICTLRDDLVFEQPEEDDRPAIQPWDFDSKGTETKTDDTFLRRQFKGDYTWLATVVPTTLEARDALQPHDPASAYSNYRYDVSVVTFRKRDVDPSETSERLIAAKMEQDGSLLIYSDNRDDVDAALDDVRPGNWVALVGVDQGSDPTNKGGRLLMKWYRLLSLDRETPNTTESIIYNYNDASLNAYTRRAMLDGPSWPNHSFLDLRVIIMPGVIGVTTQELTMEDGSLRSFQ